MPPSVSRPEPRSQPIAGVSRHRDQQNVRVQSGSVGQFDPAAVAVLADGGGPGPEVEPDAARLMGRLDRGSHHRAELPGQRCRLASTTPTSAPAARKVAATSRPMNPAPMTASRMPGASRERSRSASARVRSVRAHGTRSAAGQTGDTPVAMTSVS